MHDTGHNRRRSASANAALLLTAALIPVLGAIDTTSTIDHTEVRPWGCRTCTIPPAPLPAPDPDADPL